MYITTGEAAKLCGVKLNTIKNWIRQGDIPAIQTPGGHWRIPRASFLTFMDRFTAPVAVEKINTRKAHQRILLIDDDVSSHELMSAALEADDANYDVHSAHNGCSGMIEIGRLLPDLIVLDIMMPDINGLEIIQRLKGVESPLPDAKVLVITAASDRRLVVNRIRRAGPEALLFKPLDLNRFVSTVRVLLSTSGHMQSIQGGLSI